MGKYSSDKIAALFDIMKQLSEGRDPTSGLEFPNDSVLNSVILKRAFTDTSDILADLIGDIGSVHIRASTIRAKYTKAKKMASSLS